MDGLQIYILGSIEQLDVETMHHFEADVRVIRASEEYRILGRIQTQTEPPRLDIREYALVWQTRCSNPQASDLAFEITSQLYKHRLNSV